MPSIKNLVARSNVVDINSDTDIDDNRNTINMMIAVLSLVFFGLVLATCLLYLRRMRQHRAAMQAVLPTYADAQQQQRPGAGALTIQTTDKHGRSSVLVIGKDGQPMLSNPLSPPHSPDNVPEIRITFPDEHEESGRTKNGRVVVVRMGDATVGLEPVKEEQLPPAYEKENNSQFYSVDMDQIGGLKEKERSNYQ